MHTTATWAGDDGGHHAPRACIVDDHTTVRQWLARTLNLLGIEVCAASGTLGDGVTAILAHHPDLAVVDDRLPDGRGVDLCRKVSGWLPDVELILHTALISPLEESQAMEAGVSRVALKSIQGDELRSALADFAARHRQSG
jgi:CheY-like chemotaxis protein